MHHGEESIPQTFHVSILVLDVKLFGGSVTFNHCRCSKAVVTGLILAWRISACLFLSLRAWATASCEDVNSNSLSILRMAFGRGTIMQYVTELAWDLCDHQLCVANDGSENG